MLPVSKMMLWPSIFLILSFSPNCFCFPRSSILAEFLLQEDTPQILNGQSVIGSPPESISALRNQTLGVFQVYRPVQIPVTATHVVNQTLVKHVFSNSYGNPYVGFYEPPSTAFTDVHLKMKVTSKGRQFDRLGTVFLGDIEIFRTSTAEPNPNGIKWTYTKDVSAYISLWQQPQKVIFDLGNLVNDIYTGSFDTTITLTFFNRSAPPERAFQILPISSSRASTNQTSTFSLPSDNATTSQIISKNTTRAFISISATGQASEEFWYSNVPSSLTDTFPNTTGPLYGFSPYREVQLLIDGRLTGIVLPFPIIFTGGIVPGLWRPEVGVDAFDLRESEIDITPWLPSLRDGESHTFEIRVLGIDDNGNGTTKLTQDIGNYWVVTGKVFLFCEVEPPELSAGIPHISSSGAKVSLTSSTRQSPDGTNLAMDYYITVAREIEICSLAGCVGQTLFYNNRGHLTNQGYTQSNFQNSVGTLRSLDVLGPGRPWDRPPLQIYTHFNYPLFVNTTYTPLEGKHSFRIDANLRRGLHTSSYGRPDLSLFTLASGQNRLDATQEGTARIEIRDNSSISLGRTREVFHEYSLGSWYGRDVTVANGSIVSDLPVVVVDMLDISQWSISDIDKKFWDSNVSLFETPNQPDSLFSSSDIRARIGRGPGLGRLPGMP